MDDLAALSRANMHGSGLDGHQDFAAAAAAGAIPQFEDPEDATDETGGATHQDTESGHTADHSPVDTANRNCLRRSWDALAEHYNNRPGETVFVIAFVLIIMIMSIGGIGFYIHDRIRQYRASSQ